jgi:Mn2+/Fe2+ NRAMP family transporter
MKLWEKAVFGLTLVLAVIVLYQVFYFLNNSVQNCWEKYQTEMQAISHCENHND